MTRFDFILLGEKSGGEMRNWTDRLVLASEDGRLRVDDVLYGTDNSGDGLRKALVELFSN